MVFSFVMPIKALRFERAASVSRIITATFLTRITRDEMEKEGKFSRMHSFLKQNNSSAVHFKSILHYYHCSTISEHSGDGRARAEKSTKWLVQHKEVKIGTHIPSDYKTRVYFTS